MLYLDWIMAALAVIRCLYAARLCLGLVERARGTAGIGPVLAADKIARDAHLIFHNILPARPNSYVRPLIICI